MGWWQRLQALDDTVLAGSTSRAYSRFTAALLLRAQVCAGVAALFIAVDLAVARQPAATLLLLGVGVGVGAAVGKVQAAGAPDDLDELPRTTVEADLVEPVPSRLAVLFSVALLAGLLLAVSLGGVVNPVSAVFASIAMQAVLQRAAVRRVEAESGIEVLCRPSGAGATVRAARD